MSQCCEKCRELHETYPTMDCSCPCHKEPEAGWEAQIALQLSSQLKDKLEPWYLYLQPVFAIVQQQIDKAREEGRITFGGMNGINEAQFNRGFKAGQLQALSRIEEEVDKQISEHKVVQSNASDFEQRISWGNAVVVAALTDIAAVITKLREEYGTK